MSEQPRPYLTELKALKEFDNKYPALVRVPGTLILAVLALIEAIETR
jgi:hypothetical protein